MSSLFDAILFDFDGVLADTEPLHWACWAEVLAPLGILLEWEPYRGEYIGIDDREMLRRVAASSRPPRDWEDLWKTYPAKRALFHTRGIAAPPFHSALPALLEGLNGRYPMAVVSSSPCAQIEALLAAGGLLRHFGTVVGAESVKRQKPAPDPYLLAAERLCARSPLVVEDSETGIASGRAAGFEVLAVKGPACVPELLRRRLAL